MNIFKVTMTKVTLSKKTCEFKMFKRICNFILPHLTFANYWFELKFILFLSLTKISRRVEFPIWYYQRLINKGLVQYLNFLFLLHYLLYLSLHVVMDFINNECFLENIMNNKIVLIFVAIKNLNFLIFYTKEKLIIFQKMLA